MTTHFITVLNGIITGQHCGDIHADFFGTPYHGHDRIVIPQDIMVSNFDKVEYYDDDWQRKPDIQLIDEGLMPMPEGYIREGDSLRKMSKEERIVAGIDELPVGYKIEHGMIVGLSPVERIDAGIDELPQGHKIEDGKIIAMTQAERITAGLEELPQGHKIEDGKLVFMTMLEQMEAGQISQEEYEQYLAAETTAELSHRLAELQTPEALAQAEIDTEYAVERKIKLAALLAVKKQPGWPLEVEWPE